MKEGFLNRSINFLNIHFALQRFGEDMVKIFSGVYLYTIGIPLYLVFFIFGSIFLVRFFFRPLVFFLIPRFGLKRIIILGSLLYIGIYPLLNLVSGINIWLLVVILYFAFVDVIYWFPYHIYFTVLGDSEKRGRQIGARELFLQLTGIFAPVVGGTAIYYYGFSSAFFLAVLFFVLALIPLFYIKDVVLAKALSVREALRLVSKRGMCLYGAQGFFYNALDFTWKFVLFFLFGNTFSMGGILSVVVFINVIVIYFVGHSIDVGKRNYMYIIGILLSFLGVISKTLFAYTFTSIILVEIILMFGISFSVPYVDVLAYNESHRSGQPIWFQFFTEIGWDIGSLFSLSLVGTFLYFGGNLRYGMLLAVLALPILMFCISPMYKRVFKVHSSIEG